jgi:glycerol 2-dehydrogenase (NADP+)
MGRRLPQPIGSAKQLTKPPSKTYKLNTGASIPAVGLGTWKSQPNEVTEAVKAALQRGYRHIDTAFAYGNEKEVGDGIKASGVPRDQIWLTTKLDNPWHKRVPEAIDLSLKNLQTDYVDLYLMHWPSSTDPDDLSKHLEGWNFVDTWREMQKLVGTGKVRNIGVSNFGIKNLEKLLNDPSCKVCCSCAFHSLF